MELLRRIDFPPVWLAVFLALAWALSALWSPLGARLVAPGWILVAMALALILWAGLAFRRARTTIVPHRPPSALVANGPYRFSRNPIYLADLMILAGAALVLGAPHALLLIEPFRRVLLSRAEHNRSSGGGKRDRRNVIAKVRDEWAVQTQNSSGARRVSALPGCPGPEPGPPAQSRPQRPFQTGSRFSAKARAPSRLSSEP